MRTKNELYQEALRPVARRRQTEGTRCKVVAVDGAILIVAPVTADAAAV